MVASCTVPDGDRLNGRPDGLEAADRAGDPYLTGVGAICGDDVAGDSAQRMCGQAIALRRLVLHR